MKVGDVVRRGGRLFKLGGPIHSSKSRMLGTVVAVHDHVFPKDFELTIQHQEWLEKVGRRVEVVWFDEKIIETFAENSLEVVNNLTSQLQD